MQKSLATGYPLGSVRFHEATLYEMSANMQSIGMQSKFLTVSPSGNCRRHYMRLDDGKKEFSFT